MTARSRRLRTSTWSCSSLRPTDDCYLFLLASRTFFGGQMGSGVVVVENDRVCASGDRHVPSTGPPRAASIERSTRISERWESTMLCAS